MTLGSFDCRLTIGIKEKLFYCAERACIKSASYFSITLPVSSLSRKDIEQFSAFWDRERDLYTLPNRAPLFGFSGLF